MCISNTGSRRPHSTASSASLSQPRDDALLNCLSALKNEMQAPRSPTSTMELVSSIGRSHSSSSSSKPHITVQHNYHDHAHDNRTDYQEEHPARGGVTTPFPLKLHEMLDAVVMDGKDDIVSWQPHGRCFLVHKPKEFVGLLPKYFKLSKLASFQRQLNLYGFQRLTRGRDRGGYYHELFLRDRVFLSHSIQRIKVKGTGVRARSNPDQEPDFWAMPWVSTQGVPSVNTGNDQQISLEPTPIRSSIGQLPLQLNTIPSNPLSAAPSSFLPSLMNLAPVSMPLQSLTSTEEVENDFLLDAFSKPFHYLDPFQPSVSRASTPGVDELLATEADAFFQDFNFPEDLPSEIEDDQVFGNLLEQMIA